MVPVRYKLTLSDGVTADLLFTPHLAVYEKATGIQSSIDKDADSLAVMYRYADLMYLAAINAWELDGRGTLEDFPHTRGDFHALMQADAKGFTKAVKFCVCALTGKTEEELAEDEEKRRKNAGKTQGEAKEEDPVKKKPFSLFRLMRRSRRSS